MFEGRLEDASMLGFVGLFSANGSCRFDSGEFLPYFLLLFSCLMHINIAHEICRRLTTFEVVLSDGLHTGSRNARYGNFGVSNAVYS